MHKSREAIDEQQKALHIGGVSGSILSPIDWIKKVQGIDHLEYLDEDGVNLNWTIQLMEWYGDYVGRKVKQYCR
jgi:hypothetical protein